MKFSAENKNSSTSDEYDRNMVNGEFLICILFLFLESEIFEILPYFLMKQYCRRLATWRDRKPYFARFYELVMK